MTMNKKVLLGFVAGIIVVLAAGFLIGADDEPEKKVAAKPPASQTPAAKPVTPAAPPPAAPAPVAGAKDFRNYLTVEDLLNISGTKYKRTYADMKSSGKPDLTFSTADEGHVVLTITVFSSNYYEKLYSEFRSQDYKTMEYAFWGPKQENPPRMLVFRKGDTIIVITRYADGGQYPISVGMMERIAKTIAARL